MVGSGELIVGELDETGVSIVGDRCESVSSRGSCLIEEDTQSLLIRVTVIETLQNGQYVKIIGGS